MPLMGGALTRDLFDGFYSLFSGWRETATQHKNTKHPLLKPVFWFSDLNLPATHYLSPP
jgi:hypothetical protein